MCEHGVTVPMPIAGRVRDIDSCLALLIATLNTVPKYATVACCCGHGKMPGSVLLADGRALVLMTREQHDAYFAASPSPLAAEGEAEVTEEMVLSARSEAHLEYENDIRLNGSTIVSQEARVARILNAALRAAPSGQREEDGERMDALEAMFADRGGVMLFRWGIGGSPEVCVQRWHEWEPPLRADDPHEGKTLRAAIDAARSPTTGKAE